MITHDEIFMETLPDPSADTCYLDQEGFEEQRQQYEDGILSHICVRASCTLHIGIGQPGTIILHRISSPGLWGIQSDEGDAFLNQVYEEEKTILLAMLDAMGCNGKPAIASA